MRPAWLHPHALDVIPGHFILFNLAIGGHFTGILNPAAITALPNEGSEAKMYVDYVRVYQK